MVAETQAPPKRKVRGRSNASAAWPLEQRLAVKALYQVHQRTPAQIAMVLKRTPNQVSGLIHRLGWSKARSKKVEELTVKTDARAREQLGAVVEAVAALSEQGAVQGLQRAVDSSKAKGKFAARDYRSWAGGARDLVNVARQARGMDTEKGNAHSVNFTVNQYVVRCESAPKPESKQVVELGEHSQEQNNVAQAALAEPGVEP
jgi:hypothetical protein